MAEHFVLAPCIQAIARNALAIIVTIIAKKCKLVALLVAIADTLQDIFEELPGLTPFSVFRASLLTCLATTQQKWTEHYF